MKTPQELRELAGNVNRAESRTSLYQVSTLAAAALTEIAAAMEGAGGDLDPTIAAYERYLQKGRISGDDELLYEFGKKYTPLFARSQALRIAALEKERAEPQSQEPCPLCKGTGKLLRSSLADGSKQIEMSCSGCKGSGKVGAIPQQGWNEALRNIVAYGEDDGGAMRFDKNASILINIAAEALKEQPK